MFTYIKMSKALVPIIAVIALFVCMCCVLSLAAEPPAAAADDDDEPEGENLPKLSTNGRCGPNHGKTRCGGKACCSRYSWCGGEQGKHSAWCSGTDKGHWGGEYDGRG